MIRYEFSDGKGKMEEKRILAYLNFSLSLYKDVEKP
jgi:hypothetical protein